MVLIIVQSKLQITHKYMNKYQQLGLANVPKNFRGRSAIIVQTWWTVQSTLFALSPQVLYQWRNALLRFFGSKIGSNTLIRPTAKITYPWKLSLGDYCRIGDEVVLYSLGEIHIGSHTVISQRSYICTGYHNYHKVSFNIITKPVFIEDQVWLAADVFVAPGVRIGLGTVVGARSSVFVDLPSGMVCFGTPAKPVRERFIE